MKRPFMRKVFLSSSCIQASKIGDIVKSLCKNGIRNIELTGGTKYYKNCVNDLIFLKEKYKLSYSIHNYFPPPEKDFVLNLASDKKDTVKKSIRQIKNAIDLCNIVECGHYAFHAGFLIEIDPDELSGRAKPCKVKHVERKINRFIEHFKSVSDYASKKDVELFLENNVYPGKNFKKFGFDVPYMLVTHADYIPLRDKINFRLLLDYAHLNVSCNTLGIDFEKELKKFLSEGVEYIHISANDGKGDLNLPISKNSPSYAMLGSLPGSVRIITVEVRSRNIADIIRSYRYAQAATKGGLN